MKVAQYTFQSPSPNPVQVGRLDPSSVKEDKPDSKTDISQKPINETLEKAKQFQASQVSEVKPSVTENSQVKSSNGKSEIAQKSDKSLGGSPNVNALNNANENAAFHKNSIDIYV